MELHDQQHHQSDNCPPSPAINPQSWNALQPKQRMQQFKAHYGEVEQHLRGVEQHLEHTANSAKQALSDGKRTGLPQSKIASLEKTETDRTALLATFKRYRLEKAAPAMLDSLYLNQTRQHLGSIVE